MKKKTAGFTLLEVSVAVCIAGGCLIAILCMFPTGMKTNQDTLEETVAASLLSQIHSVIRSYPSGCASNSLYGISFPSAGASPVTNSFFLSDAGETNNPSIFGVNYRATLVITPPAASSHAATLVRVILSWPAQVDTNPLLMPTNYSGSLETVFAIDRN